MEQETQIDDSELIERCRKLDEDAFGILYQRYRLQLFSYLHKLLPGNNSLVDDIFQQVWIKVFLKLESYSDNQKFLAWLCRIGHNLVMDYFRKQKHFEFTELDENISSVYIGAAEQIDQGIIDEALNQAKNELSKEQREVLELRKNGISFKEIADIQKTNLNTVLGRMHYAVGKLRGLLRDYL